MMFRTCLLVSDDPDDHAQFTEVVNEISNSVAVMALLDVDNAIKLLALKKHIPDYIIVDLSMNDFRIDFFRMLEEDPELSNIPLVAYGEFSEFAEIPGKRVSAFLENEFTYSRLKDVLAKLLRAG